MSNLTDSDIRNAADNLFDKKEPFTAFHVTLELQALGHDFKHRDEKETIHRTLNQMLVEPPYSMFQISHVRKNGRSFLVYHDWSTDPYDVKMSQDPNQKQAPSQPTPKSKSLFQKGSKTYDNRGRYTIPTKIMNNFGDDLYIEVSKRSDGTGLIEITDDPMSGGKKLTKCESYFRVSPRWFKKAFGKLPTDVDITHIPKVAGGYSSVMIIEK
jgi:hypothetical protein